jgi:hypothetical protein
MGLYCCRVAITAVQHHVECITGLALQTHEILCKQQKAGYMHLSTALWEHACYNKFPSTCAVTKIFCCVRITCMLL